jgi:hypothetical protein
MVDNLSFFAEESTHFASSFDSFSDKSFEHDEHDEDYTHDPDMEFEAPVYCDFVNLQEKIEKDPISAFEESPR